MNEAQLAHYMKHYPIRRLKDSNGAEIDQFVTCPVRLAFAKLATPHAKQSGKLVYSTSLIFPAAADLSVAMAMANAAGVAEFGAGYGEGVKSGDYKFPFKRQKKPADKGYDGFGPEGFFAEAQTMYAVPVVDVNKLPLSPADGAAVYSGMWALVRLRVFAYGKGVPQSTKGVGFGLVSIQKIADDVEFKGGDSTDVFDEIVPVGGPAAGAAKAPTTAFDYV